MKHNLTLKRLCALLVAALVALPAFAQNADGQSQHKIDSLLSFVKPDSPDSVKAKCYNQIIRTIGATGHPDTIIKYAQLSIDYCHETDLKLLILNNNYIGVAYYLKGNLRGCIKYFKETADYCIKNGEETKVVSMYCDIADFYQQLNLTDSCFYYINKGLEISTKKHDTISIAHCYNQLAMVSLNKQLNTNAETYTLQALHFDSLKNNIPGIAKDLWVLGVIYTEKNKCTKSKGINTLYESLNCLKKSAVLYDSIRDANKFLVYGNIANTYILLANLTNEAVYADSCIFFYKQSEDFCLKEGNGMNDYLELSATYTAYLLFYKKYKEAKKFVLSLEKYITDETPKIWKWTYNQQLQNIYEQLGDWENAYKQSKIVAQYNKEITSDSVLNVIADAKSKQAVITEKIEHEKDLQLHAAETQKMRIVIFSLIGGMVSVLAVIVLVLRVLSVRKRANNVLAEQKKEIETQRDHIEAQNKEIQASINYARRIQRALLTPDEAIASVFPDYFLLYKPRSVVSGDFYWVGQFGDNKVCIVADCTGHGVPGGFMSVLGMTNLNYIVGQDIAPEAILNKLRDAIMWNLRQNEGNPEELTAQVLDGMDVAAYVVNERQMTLSFAGANNPLVLIRDGEVQVIKPDKMPVGISVVMKPFQSVTMELRKGDCLYTYSDGFQDQFNIESEKKFQKSRLRDLLLEIHQRPMNEQRELLNLVFKEWRGPAENQTDDVVIMGVRI